MIRDSRHPFSFDLSSVFSIFFRQRIPFRCCLISKTKVGQIRSLSVFLVETEICNVMLLDCKLTSIALKHSASTMGIVRRS